ncbi:hypothetical protein [Sedimenticola hydrogenitrophicus]|uniref:hypothetical protein n=1 Tax=Sedimenticola hydrogenitrophicus TaxID=2967975 RepID=UPI0021A55D64|nr:hypothetical protein [Sedimenticola hydrogenitrophicus]
MKKLSIFSLLLLVTGCVSNPPQEGQANRCDLPETMADHQFSAPDLARMTREVNRLYAYPDGHVLNRR